MDNFVKSRSVVPPLEREAARRRFYETAAKKLEGEVRQADAARYDRPAGTSGGLVLRDDSEFREGVQGGPAILIFGPTDFS